MINWSSFWFGFCACGALFGAMFVALIARNMRRK